MGDSDEKNKQAAPVPSWQEAASTPDDAPTESTQERARRFLEDETVKESSRDKKIEFLRSKGFQEEDINKLLAEAQSSTTTTPSQPVTKTQQQETQLETTQLPPPSSSSATEPHPDRPPIVTYPEFLTKPIKPPPLITASGLFNSLSAVAGLSTLVYGATKYLVSPMVDALTDARVEFHQNANRNLTQLVDKLEHTVSEIPASYHHAAASRAGKPLDQPQQTPKDDDDDNNDNSSSYDDPTELFSRDIGVQTSPPPSTPSSPAAPYRQQHHKPAPNTATNTTTTTQKERIQHQADRLARLSVSARGLATDLIGQAEDLAETKNVLDGLGRDLHSLTYPPESFGGSSAYLYGAAHNTGEPDDEIKRVKANIRSVKGVLLSTRSFPASTVR